jgi:hypothetical protein
MRTRDVLIAASLLCFAGCKSATDPTPENYLNTINAYLGDHPDCLLDGSIHFPYETSDAEKTKQMDTLVKAEVLAVTREPAIHVSRYTLTPAGSSAGRNLCYGFRTATSIVSSTPPAPANGFTETQVVYTYVLHDERVWAKEAAVVAAFPALANGASGNATDKITLALDRVGWSVPD